MPVQPSYNVENNFTKGLITTATGLNFPPDACTETFNCEFDWDGSVTRRLGFDFETNYSTKTINRTDKALTTFLWRNVAGNGDLALAVLQIGLTIYFWEIIADQSFSEGAIASTVTLTPIAGAVHPELNECQFSDGNGYLFITHPNVDPVRVSFDQTSQVATATTIKLKIRDFTGVTDPYAVDFRPTTTFAGMDISHYYNLLNQGWNVLNLGNWDVAQTTMPSNADVMWRFEDASGNFDASTASINRIASGNTPAPKGHFVLEVSNQDRNAASGLAGVTSPTTGSQRVSTSAFFAGRVFYAGINYNPFNSNIYFTQIIERDEQYAFCYQLNDPTSEELFALLPSDGGVISIPEAGTIHKLVAIPGGLLVHGDNGVWFIAGSQGIGFTANDYTVQKISTVPTLTHASFVIVNGYPIWWNSEGIYGIKSSNPQDAPGSYNLTTDYGGNLNVAYGRLPTVESLTDATIWSFFQDIPLNSKRFARGIYHYKDRHVRWIYRSESTSEITNQYEYDRVLNFNVITKAFYPWTITDSPVKVNGIIASDVLSGNTSILDVVDGANNVVDNSGNQVIAFSTTGADSVPFDKYFVSYPDGVNHRVTFASKTNSSYLDWLSYDLVERSFDSYLITGYKLRGGALRKFQDNWIRIFADMEDEEVHYYFQGIWDYATTGSGTGRWSARQLVQHTDTNYSTVSRRLKVRGHGLALQFKVTSVEQKPFTIVGWSMFDTTNMLP